MMKEDKFYSATTHFYSTKFLIFFLLIIQSTFGNNVISSNFCEYDFP